MNIFNRLRAWWQWRTGEDETPFDGDAPAWMISLLVHLLILVGIAVACLRGVESPNSLILELAEPEAEQLDIPKNFYFSNEPSQRVTAFRLCRLRRSCGERL